MRTDASVFYLLSASWVLETKHIDLVLDEWRYSDTLSMTHSSEQNRCSFRDFMIQEVLNFFFIFICQSFFITEAFRCEKGILTVCAPQHHNQGSLYCFMKSSFWKIFSNTAVAIRAGSATSPSLFSLCFAPPLKVLHSELAIGLFLLTSSFSLHDSDSVQRSVYTGQELEYAFFVHSLCILGKLLIYTNGRKLFPVRVRKCKGKIRDCFKHLSQACGVYFLLSIITISLEAVHHCLLSLNH